MVFQSIPMSGRQPEPPDMLSAPQDQIDTSVDTEWGGYGDASERTHPTHLEEQLR